MTAKGVCLFRWPEGSAGVQLSPTQHSPVLSQRGVWAARPGQGNTNGRDDGWSWETRHANAVPLELGTRVSLTRELKCQLGWEGGRQPKSPGFKEATKRPLNCMGMPSGEVSTVARNASKDVR